MPLEMLDGQDFINLGTVKGALFAQYGADKPVLSLFTLVHDLNIERIQKLRQRDKTLLHGYFAEEFLTASVFHACHKKLPIDMTIELYATIQRDARKNVP